MQFVSLQFFAFFIVLISILKISKNENIRQWVLLAASYIFYAYWDYRFLLLLFVQTMTSYIVGKELARKKSKIVFVLGMIVALSILGFFKYFNFFVESFCAGFKIRNATSLNLLLPVGISFYTFQAISYMADVYCGVIGGSSLRKVALYVGFFPQLEKNHEIHRKEIIAGLQIFLFGVVKKFVIADRLGVCVDAIYDAPAAYSWVSILLAVITYSFQIYCDFSGYSDMAIGVAKSIGYDLGRNFNCPYIARNPSEFWSRWHISLSSWFKEYVYFPLGGNRKGYIRMLINIMIVMLLSGLWHGAAWTFVVWGAIHGMGSVVHKLFVKFCSQYGLCNMLKHRTIQGISALLNFIFVSICWVFFRAESLGKAVSVLEGLITLQTGIEYIYVYTIIYSCILIIGQLYVAVYKGRTAEYPDLNFNRFRSWFIFWLVLLLILVFYYTGNTAFIYSQF